VIEGEQVRLRPINQNDLVTLRRWAADPKVMRFWANPQPIVTDEQFEADLRGRFSRFDNEGYFIIEDLAGKAVGRIEFERLSMIEGSAEVMILIGESDARGRGLGSEAMNALLGYLFRQRDLHRVYLTVLNDNPAAIRSYEKVGFTVEGILREDVFFDGIGHDQLAMSMLRTEFELRWPTPAKSSQ
jgi:RimJ/RimL family protein N-acetyltransferase